MIIASEEVFGVSSLPRCLFHGSRARYAGPQDVEVARQFTRSARSRGFLRRGRAALHDYLANSARRRYSFRQSEMCEVGRNFANKLWNATRFLLDECARRGQSPSHSTPVEASPQCVPENLIDQWITSAFFSCVRDVEACAHGISFRRCRQARLLRLCGMISVTGISS
jgi:hypothetical protein